MPWVRLDEHFPSHRKVRPLTDAAFRLHVSGICWAARHLTDGFIPQMELPYVSDVRNPEKAVTALEHRCLWIPGPLGWQINDYLEYNPPATEVEKARSERVEKARKAAKVRWER